MQIYVKHLNSTQWSAQSCFYSLINSQNTLSNPQAFCLEAQNHYDSPGDSKSKADLASEKEQNWGYSSCHVVEELSPFTRLWHITRTDKRGKKKTLQSVLSCDDRELRKTWGIVLAMSKLPALSTEQGVTDNFNTPTNSHLYFPLYGTRRQTTCTCKSFSFFLRLLRASKLIK